VALKGAGRLVDKIVKMEVPFNNLSLTHKSTPQSTKYSITHHHHHHHVLEGLGVFLVP